MKGTTDMGDLTGAAARLRENQPPERRLTAPVENGKRLATIRRRDGDELRLNWAEFKGHPFLNIRVWREGDAGQWYPVKDTGLTVRLAELADFAEGIGAAVELAAQETPAQDNTRPPGKPQAGPGHLLGSPKGHQRRPAPACGLPGAPWYAPFDDSVDDIGRA